MVHKNWSRNEHIVAFNLYCKIPFTKINASYRPVKELAKIIGRTDGSVAMKLANFARLDPALQARNVKGLTQGAKGEEEVWKEFNGNWGELAWQSEQILAKYKQQNIEQSAEINLNDLPTEGKERESIVRTRVNQSFFRKAILASYDSTCCITGLSVPELLVASHIIPWSKDEKNRVNPSNGLCLNALHDKAFDTGLITVTPDYKIQLSNMITGLKDQSSLDLFLPFEGKAIALPGRFHPDPKFLEWHNQNVFRS